MKCSVQISNIILSCEHIWKWLKCHKAQASKIVSYWIKVEIVMSNYKHQVKIHCCDFSLQNDYSCSVMCEVILICEHDCKHACKDCNSKIDNQIFQRTHDVCKMQCSRSYMTCNHACLSICHDNDSCSLCNESCEIHCSHSHCSKKCQESCISYVEDCSWSCSHREKCQMSCVMSCNLLSYLKRCSKILSCDHRCSSVCEKICSDVQHCQKCIDILIKKMMIDYIMKFSYAEIDLDESSCIISSCNHILILKSMNDYMSISNYYTLSDKSDDADLIVRLKSSLKSFSIVELKNCSMCHCFLRNINKYDCIVQRAWIDKTTKKFIVWINMQFVSLIARMKWKEIELRKDKTKSQDSTQQLSFTLELLSLKSIQLKEFHDQQIKNIINFTRSDARFKSILKLQKKIKQFLKKVDEVK